MLTNKDQPIGLRDLIEKVREELLEEHNTSIPLFAIDQIELEISFTVERSMEGGVNLHVVQSGVEKTIGDVQTVKVMLESLITPEMQRQRLKPEDMGPASQALMRGEE